VGEAQEPGTAGLFHTYIPRPPLSKFIACFWLAERAAQPRVRERALPTGTIELVFSLRDDEMRIFDRRLDRGQSFRGAMVCGPHSEHFVIDSAPDELILGVHFRPGGAAPFFTLPAGELHNAHVSLEALWGANAARLREQLLEVVARPARFPLLEQLLIGYAPRPLERHPAVAFALRAFQRGPHMRTIAGVADQIGLSHRRFIQLFRDEVGLTPKQFCRIRRFQAALRSIDGQQQVAWADVALACGYYDQAHCIHEFQAFAGLTPTTYLRERSVRLNHVLLPA
jgi:AraC-like DNA-binding protein